MGKLDPAVIKQAAVGTVDAALTWQQPKAQQMVARLRLVHPDKTPAEIMALITKDYLATVAAGGVGAGAAAAVPNGAVQVPAALADLTLFLKRSVLYVLAAAEVYGVHSLDLERRRFLVMMVLAGDSANKKVVAALGKKAVPHWGKGIIKAIPMAKINAVNKVLGPRFIAKYGTKQGVLVLGKQVPLALGAVIGVAGNTGFGYGIVRSTKKMLGPVPDTWDEREEARES
ncbi:hypothetical protein JZY06_09185 [Corynebacterium sp. CCM 8862]|uniref:EcsC protein family protein n=1 Tax=Corynebacterium mendelii TaxID=2765362 RepID=A0A939E2W6_9CORY|nr:hypothetical protein [Corynebacterium mendelii]